LKTHEDEPLPKDEDQNPAVEATNVPMSGVAVHQPTINVKWSYGPNCSVGGQEHKMLANLQLFAIADTSASTPAPAAVPLHGISELSLPP
jgi:hypothetical protein